MAKTTVEISIVAATGELAGLAFGRLIGFAATRFMAARAASSLPLVNQGSQIILRNGYYEAQGLKISDHYYNRLWSNGRGAPFIVAREVLEVATRDSAHESKIGFYNYCARGWHMVFNPTTKEIWHLQPLK